MSGPIKKIQGSAKDILFQDDNMFFQFSDRYSIYDWGEMPDHIENKGANLFKMGVFFFEHLQKKGFKTHFMGVQNDLIQVKKFRVIKPELIEGSYDYAKINQAINNFLIPLEVIFRFGVPQGSSLLNAKQERLRELGLEKVGEGQKFEAPLIEFSTKLEPSDRMLLTKEAQEISGLSPEQFEGLKKLAGSLALTLKELTDQRGLKLWDGKFEFALDHNNELVLIDSVGVDELRLTLEGAPLSKECLRQFYAKSDWRQKLLTRKTQDKNWRELMLANEEVPAPLPLEALKMAKELYQLLHDVLAFGKGLEQLRKLSKDIQNYLKPKRALIIGDGGREHALALKLAQSPQVEKVFVQTAKGNIFGHSQIEAAPINNDKELYDFIKNNSVDLTVIGPEKPLVEGLADKLRDLGVSVFGPGREAARLEASKTFSKEIMLKAGIPTAAYESFDDYKNALEFLEKTNWSDGYVVKADGLAAGKGVIVCPEKESAMAALKELMVENSLKLDSTKVIIEERLIGRELSLFALFDEKTCLALGGACDYKRIRDNDEGPNTGGMGTYSPVDWMEEAELKKLNESVFPALHKQLKAINAPYRGVVFAGIMQTARGPKVLEFNVRFGDPETQSLLPRIQNDFFKLLDHCAQKKLQDIDRIALSADSVVHVVMAARGYPGTEGEAVAKGDEIEVKLPLSGRSHWVTFAGAKMDDDKLKTCGGRVMGVSSRGVDRQEARNMAYEKIKQINFEGAQYRNDIGK